MNKLSIIIPAYNEEKTIHLILDKVREVELIHGIKKELIIVNDFSTDDTLGVIENYIQKNSSLPIKVFSDPTNICNFCPNSSPWTTLPVVKKSPFWSTQNAAPIGPSLSNNSAVPSFIC